MIADAPHLLPDNATPLEQELARATATIDALDPAVIETIWDAWACPAALLPWLAWALSIDVWDDAWPEVTKRQAIADSPYYHRIKGTRLAVEMALDLAGRPYDIVEWFEAVPTRRRGTAFVMFEAPLDQIGPLLARVRRFADAAKPKSRAIFLAAGEIVPGEIPVGGGIVADELITIEPYAYAGEEVDGVIVAAAGILDETLTTVEPY